MSSAKSYTGMTNCSTGVMAKDGDLSQHNLFVIDLSYAGHMTNILLHTGQIIFRPE